MSINTDDIKPVRLYYKSYLQMIRNSIGTEMFRNFYIRLPDGKEIDAMADGSDSCAFFVSSLLTIVGKISGMHGTVGSAVKDMEESGWQKIMDGSLEAGDVVVWSEQELEGKRQSHVGFYIGNDRAVSTSWKEKRVVEHAAHFDDGRGIESVYRLQW